MNKQVVIASKNYLPIELKSVGLSDVEDLRIWKNANRMSFFHTSQISAQQQLLWYEKYLNNPNDFMFMVYANNVKIGCMGFRKMDADNTIDVYNIILGNADFGKKGYMATALKTMCNFGNQLYKLDITVKVLKSNPASNWYKNNNFIEISPQNDYFYLKLNKDNFEEYTFETITT